MSSLTVFEFHQNVITHFPIQNVSVFVEVQGSFKENLYHNLYNYLTKTSALLYVVNPYITILDLELPLFS